jgi:hypothetical protein
MYTERPMPRAEEFRPANELESEIDIPERLRNLHEAETKFLSKGVFFDVYGIELANDAGMPEPFVFKDFRSGDVLTTPEEQVALFQHQYYEWQQLRHIVGEEFFPESYWIRSREFSDDEAHGFYEQPGKTANTMSEFIKVQLDRQLASRYSSDDKKSGAIKKAMAAIGKTATTKHENTPFIGAIVQERVNGVPMAEALKRENAGVLREPTRKLIRGLREYHAQNPYGAFTWHGLNSDNVMAETDPKGVLTGRVCIIDANFTERPNITFKEKVVAKLEKDVFKKLESALGL